MSWEEYAKMILGNKRVIELKKEYNLCTKRYTYGRYKNFLNRLKKEIKEYEKQEEKINELQKRIDKAIEYIENDLSHIKIVRKRNKSYLLKILKGEENVKN
jgi:hypothetical protein